MTTTKTPAVVTRFAPSPTGRLHVGGARTALFNWAYARGKGGVFILRIEDTDQARSSDEDAQGVMDAMLWLGLTWDEGPVFTSRGMRAGGDAREVGPFFQAQRKAQGVYDATLQVLLDAGRAYYAFETPEELAAQRDEARKARKPFRYDRAALKIPEAQRRQRADAGEPCVVRFLAPDKEPVVVRDEALGEVTLAPGEVDDFVIRKADGFPTYHFACVVDDESMGVTHVIRGQEHLINTPKHVLLQQALGFATPTYAHLPLISNPDGSKMSKRDRDKALRQACKKGDVSTSPISSVDAEEFAAWLKDNRQQLDADRLTQIADALHVALPEVDVNDFRDAGYLPGVLCNYLALLGWSPGNDIEKFDLAFLAERFDLDRIGKTNARFDRDKLLAFDTDAMATMDDNAFLDVFVEWARDHRPDLLEALSEEQLQIAAAGVRPRTKTLRNAADSLAFLLVDDAAVEYDTKAVEKTLLRDDGAGVVTLRELRSRLADLGDFTPDAVNALVRWFAEQHSIGLGKVAQPLRVALTGTTVSPPIDVTVSALGKDRALTRIDRALETFGAAALDAGE